MQTTTAATELFQDDPDVIPFPDPAPVLGTVYLICFHDQDGNKAQLAHAGHYVGWASNLTARLAHHQKGTGARLTAAAAKAGLELRVVQTWEQKSRHFERKLHTRHGSRICPVCKAAKRTTSEKEG